jgi:HAD superfamily hydrolase (TIGR01509 family)
MQMCRDHSIRGAIFDIDGTLIDSMPIWDELGARYLRSLHIEPEPELGQVLFPMTVAEGVRYLKSHYALSQSEDSIRDGLNAQMEQFYRQEVQLKPGAAEVVKEMYQAGIMLVLATIGDPSLEKAALHRLGIDQYFSQMFVCETYHTTKRESKIYQIAADAMNLAPRHVLVVEDIYQAIHAAGSAGFVTAAIYDAASEQDMPRMKNEADYWFQTFKE